MHRTPLRAARARTLATLAAVLCTLAHPASALPVISEVLYDAAGSDDGQSFVELYGAPGTVLDGLRLEGVNGANGSVGPVVALTGTIPTDGFFVVADGLADGTTLVAAADLIGSFDFQNGPYSIVLRTGDAVLDALGYGAFAAGDVFAGEGQPAPDAPAGSSLARAFADVDTDDNLTDFVVLASPTPGSGSLLAPEPSTAALLGVGMLWLAGCRRRAPRPAA